MLQFWEHREEMLEAFGLAESSILVHLNGNPEIWFFQSLLELARKGLAVEVAGSESLYAGVDINPTYFDNLRVAGGAWFAYPAEKRIRDLPPSFILLDGTLLLLESVQPANPRRLEMIRAADLIGQYGQRFRKLKEQGLSGAVIPLLDPDGQKNPAGVIAGRPLTAWFEARPRTVEPGGTVELGWEVTGATVVEITPGIGICPPRGTAALPLGHSTEFRLRAVGSDRELSRVLSVEVDKNPKILYRITTLDFATGGEIPLYFREDFPDHYGIIHGQAVTLYWEVRNAGSVEIDGIGPVAANGFKVLTPEKLTAYTIIARNGGMAAKKVVVINVFPMPAMEKIRSVLPDSMEVRSVLHFNNIQVPAWLNQPLNWEIDQHMAAPAADDPPLAIRPGKEAPKPPRKGWLTWFKRKKP
ncbi:MAG TPA: hypothetical protein PKE06_05185 [Flavilitoribacter sp.]|nr:hypothetical protein [Flavilitoribacter sp.]HMQ86564.1 hypothetical protein [Flavilitoribacter sp.]